MNRSSVCNGAMLRCSLGSVPGTLVVLRPSLSADTMQAIGTVQDSRPMENILPFGTCSAAAHPLISTGAAPCIPQTNEVWTQQTPSIRYQGQAALRGDATLRCEYGGIISVIQPVHLTVSLAEQGM